MDHKHKLASKIRLSPHRKYSHFFQVLSERMYKKIIYVISGLNSWLRKCAIIQGELIRADNQAVRAAARSKAVICFSELQTSTNSVVGVKETNKKIFFL